MYIWPAKSNYKTYSEYFGIEKKALKKNQVQLTGYLNIVKKSHLELVFCQTKLNS